MGLQFIPVYTSTLWGKKTAPVYFRNDFVQTYYSEIISGT